MAAFPLSPAPQLATAAALAGVPQLLDPACSCPQPLPAWQNRPLTRLAAHPLLDCRRVDVVRLSPELILLVDEQASLQEPGQLNLLATSLWYQHRPDQRGRACIVGPAILCRATQLA